MKHAVTVGALNFSGKITLRENSWGPLLAIFVKKKMKYIPLDIIFEFSLSSRIISHSDHLVQSVAY